VLARHQEEATLFHPIAFNVFKLEGNEQKNAQEVDIKELAKLCEPKFAAAYRSSMGGKEIKTGVHRNFEFYTQVAVDAVKKATSDSVMIPNGCCTNRSCPLNVYYRTVLDELKILS
jgi:hypothetical protein